MQPVYFLIIGIHEGGFRFVVGRAGGIMTEKGRIPFRSIFQEGVYYLEDSTVPEKGCEINIHNEGRGHRRWSIMPSLTPSWGMAACMPFSRSLFR